MQKKLIALAIAGLSTAAFAQSNVTISGQMRVSVDNVNASGATAANSNYTSRTRVVDNNSNIKFAGEENLGNGLTAWFQVESAIGTDNNNGTTAGNTTATNTTTIGTRNTAVGIKGAFGNAFVGKWDTHYNSQANVEGAGLADGLALAASSLNILNTINGTAITGSGRNNNVIAYVTPNMNGFVGQLAYTTVGELTTPNLAKKDGGWNLKLSYDNGPIAVSYSYLAVNGAGAAAATAAGFSCLNTTTGVTTTRAACTAGTEVATAAVAANTGNGNDIRSNRLGFAYSFPMGLKVGLIWDKSKNTNNTGAASTYAERSAWALPVSYVTGPHRISYTYAKANNVNTQAGTTADSGANMNMLGYEYSMSKRTSVSATWVQINNKSAGVYDFWHPSSNVANGAGALAAGSAGADPRMLSLGLKHTF